ncbi:hypothetical protein VNO80_03444 [Phaseolus coccineus]|uniref:Uncharacterized protein n=1 Tax=Phaseolus coccineus TaxID=3886 RepID=A0AAN9NYN7_PHACN
MVANMASKKARCLISEKKGKALNFELKSLLIKMKELEQNLIKMTLAHDEMHAESFKKFVRQATFLYGDLTEERQFKIDKDVYQGQLILVKDISTRGNANKKSQIGKDTKVVEYRAE